MPSIHCIRECEIEETFRVHQVMGMLDVPLATAKTESFSIDVPGIDEDWRIGAIIGPSGSGKTTVARVAFGSKALRTPKWSPSRAMIDHLGDRPIEEIMRVLTSVGLGSAPSWLRPYHVLSCGEQFRAQMARRLLSEEPVTVCDEFTSPLDRTLARNLSIAISRHLRREGCSSRFIAIASHIDVLPWLAPDWTLDMSTQSLQWRRLRRPPLHFAVRRCHRSLWSRFAKHHYLSGSLACAAKCYAALEQNEPIAFCAVISMLGRPEIHRITRLVTLPNYQGLGIGGKLLDLVARAERDEGYRVHITTSHPGLASFLDHSRHWRSRGRRLVTDAPRQVGNCLLQTSRGRLTATFEFTPQPPSLAVTLDPAIHLARA